MVMKKTTRKRTKMGRPPMPDCERMSAQILIRFTGAQRRRIERAAKAAGQDLSAFTRAAVLSACDRQERGKP